MGSFQKVGALFLIFTPTADRFLSVNFLSVFAEQLEELPTCSEKRFQASSAHSSVRFEMKVWRSGEVSRQWSRPRPCDAAITGRGKAVQPKLLSSVWDFRASDRSRSSWCLKAHWLVFSSRGSETPGETPGVSGLWLPDSNDATQQFCMKRPLLRVCPFNCRVYFQFQLQDVPSVSAAGCTFSFSCRMYFSFSCRMHFQFQQQDVLPVSAAGCTFCRLHLSLFQRLQDVLRGRVAEAAGGPAVRLDGDGAVL